MRLLLRLRHLRLCAALLGTASILAASHASAATTFITAKNPSLGKDAYQLIRDALGSGAIESPDLGPVDVCHPGTLHISTQPDSATGYAFRFNIHEGLDCDPTGTTTTPRERVEIKGYDGSSSNVKAFEGNRLTYSWLFRIDSNMNIGDQFTHVFQLKSVDGVDSSHPLLTFTGANGLFEVRHGNDDRILGTANWSSFQGRWVEASVDATFSHTGRLRVTLTDMATGNVLISFTKRRIDMFKDGTYVRPKWGIYRENIDQNLGNASIRFADFVIVKP